MAKRLSQTGSNSRPFVSVQFWIRSPDVGGFQDFPVKASCLPFSNTFTFSQSMLCPLLRSTCSLIAYLELADLDLCSEVCYMPLNLIHFIISKMIEILLKC